MASKNKIVEIFGIKTETVSPVSSAALHNLRCQVADLEATGQTIKFNAPSSRVWVHLRTMEILGHHLPHGLKQALESTQRKWLILLM